MKAKIQLMFPNHPSLTKKPDLAQTENPPIPVVETHVEPKPDVLDPAEPLIQDNRPRHRFPALRREIQGSQGPFGRIRLNTIPKADEFYVNRKLVVDENGAALKISGQDILLPPGELQVELRNKAFDKKWKGSISVSPDVRQEKDIVFR